MDEQPNQREFVNEVSSFTDEAPAAKGKGGSASGLPALGKVTEIAGSGSQALLDASVLTQLQAHADPSVATSGQVGSQVKMVVGNSWLIANVRTLRAGDDGKLVAHVDFLGEGSEDSSGKMSNFRRGVTRYPIPGCPVLPATTEYLRAIFAASDEPHIAIDTVD